MSLESLSRYDLTSLNRCEAKTKSFSDWLLLLNIVLLSPIQSHFPLLMNTIFSPIPNTEFMS